MTTVILPNLNITGDNLWSQVQGNDQAIINTINGDLDNGNIAANAGINGSKLLDLSIMAAKIGAAQVTAGKIGAGAVTTDKLAGSIPSGKLKWAFYGNAGTVKASTGILANVEVFPGVFLAIATVSTNGNCHTFGLGGSGGVSSVAYPEPPFTNLARLSGQGGDKYSSATFAALVTVTAATDLQLSAYWVSGSMFGNLSVFGLSA